MTEPLYGLQIYTVREALAEDFKGTLQRLHDLGIRHLEVFRGMPLPPEEAAAMTSAATAFLDALDAAQRDAAQFDLTDSERSAWSNLPVGDFPREGARLGDMTEVQQSLAWALVEASLSARGKQRIDEILTMESITEAMGWASLDESHRQLPKGPTHGRPQCFGRNS